MAGSRIEVDVDGFVEKIVQDLDEGRDEAREKAKEIAGVYQGIEEVPLSALGYAAEQGRFWEVAERVEKYAEREDLVYDHPDKLFLDFESYHHKFFDDLYDDLGVEVPTGVEPPSE